MTQPMQAVQPMQASVPQAISGSMEGGIAIRCFGVGRLVAFLPKKQVIGTKYQSTEPQDQIIADVVVLDGGPINFGGKADNQGNIVEPDLMTVAPAPFYVAENVVVNKASLIKSVARGLPNPLTGSPAQAVVGRLWQDPAFRNAWKQREATPEDFALFNQWAAMVHAGAFTNPVPTRIGGFVANPVPAWPQQNPAQPVQQMVYPQAQPAAAPVSAPAQQSYDWTLTEAPVPPWDAAQWLSFQPFQREQMLTMAGRTNPNIPQAAPAAQYPGQPPF